MFYLILSYSYLHHVSPKRTLKVGSVLDPTLKDELVGLLKEFEDFFAYNVEEMSGIDPDVVVHELNIDPSKKTVRQKKRPISQPGIRLSPRNSEVIKVQVHSTDSLPRLDSQCCHGT